MVVDCHSSLNVLFQTMATKRPLQRSEYECKKKVECMSCGQIILSESKSRHTERKHKGLKVSYRFHNDSKQPKLMFGGPSSTKDNTPAANDDNGDGLPVFEEVTGASDHEERGGAVAVGGEQEHSVRQEKLLQEPGGSGSVQTVQLRRLCPVFHAEGEVDNGDKMVSGNDDSSDNSATVTVAADDNDNDEPGHVGKLSPGSRKYAPGDGGEGTDNVTVTSADEGEVLRSLSVDNEEDIGGEENCYDGRDDDEAILFPSAAPPAEIGPKQPMLEECHPKMYGNRQRDFQQSWFRNHSWLGYDVVTREGYCFPCQKFMNISFKFTNWKKCEKLGKHSHCDTHTTAMIKWEESRAMENNNSVLSQVSSLHASQVAENRRYLEILIQTVAWLGRQDVSFRGHAEDRTALPELSSTNRGNFLEILSLQSQHSTFLKEKLDMMTKNKTKGLWTSGKVQNELIELIGSFTRKKIVEEINNKEWGEVVIGVISDETSDITRWEQISLVISYIDSEGTKRESFLGFIQTPQTDGDTIFRLITEELKKLGLCIGGVVGLGFDGAGNMAGINKV